MTDEIKIQAQPDANPNRFRFIIDREVWKQQVIFIDADQAAQGSPLATELFALDGVERVEFNGRMVLITQKGGIEWLPLAKSVGAAIRSFLQKGGTVVADGYEPKLPPEEQLRLKVQSVVDSDVNPAIAMHGGFVEIVDVKDATIFIKMGGGCHGCGMADVTLKQGVERMIRDSVPEVAAVLDSTDHASGANPYYEPGRS